MKKLVASLVAVLVMFGLALADPPHAPEQQVPIRSICPITHMGEDCMSCHVLQNRDGKVVFGIKEVAPDAGYKYPNYATRIVDGKGYFYMDSINSTLFKGAVEYCVDRHNLKHMIIEINNPGGGLFEAWRMVGLIREYEKQGVIFETRCYGFGMSAGFIMLVGGTPGHRLASPYATLMWHELWSLSFLKLETPSKNEDEAAIMRGLQDTIHQWMSERSKMDKEDIDEMVRRKEWWMAGREAYELGFVDGLIGE